MTVQVTVRTADNPARITIGGEEIFVPPLTELDFNLYNDGDALQAEKLPEGTEPPADPE